MSDYEITKVPGHSVLGEIIRLRDEFPRSGLYPVILGDDEELAILAENSEFAQQEGLDAVTILDRSRQINVGRWLVEHADDLELNPEVAGDWPRVPPEAPGLIAHRDILTRREKPTVAIGLIKVSAAWKVFAHLGFGNWNDCPQAAEHCAMHRYWQERYGAEVVAITGIVQCTVARPPRDRSAALALAKEQYVYCYDIVDQGTNTIAALAASLIDAPYWYFWWD